MRFNIVIYQKFRNYKFSGLAELKISETKLNYATLEGNFFHVFINKKYEKMNFLYIVASAIKKVCKKTIIINFK